MGISMKSVIRTSLLSLLSDSSVYIFLTASHLFKNHIKQNLHFIGKIKNHNQKGVYEQPYK